MSQNDNSTIYEMMGGAESIRRLVEVFYSKVQKEPLLSPLFPANISPVIEKQIMFLTQFFGGPTLYSDSHGHPMMRARHLPFPVTKERADAWLGCMQDAMDDVGMPADLKTFMIDRLRGPAYHFVNTTEEE
ncbi:globin domain-containing protein [Paenibacillus roseipurpureus]|uniref:Globin n=1 Tax=Paenibacillus roseopurpureus TaxID=2918901 RepID=A0AA96LT32_9BACL|nr:globin [Paenibacillus sp. MBLB1832]WNR45579.1 globin [Paenibacillus sp. MBLB1832]